jgi:hypothetical protein
VLPVEEACAQEFPPGGAHGLQGAETTERRLAGVNQCNSCPPKLDDSVGICPGQGPGAGPEWPAPQRRRRTWTR